MIGVTHTYEYSLILSWCNLELLLTNTNMSFQNHADIIGTIPNRKGDRAAFGVLHHSHDLNKAREKEAKFTISE